MAEEDKQSPFKESSVFPWLQTAVDMWLNMAKAMPSNSDTALGTQTAIQNRFTKQLDTNLHLLKSFSRMMKRAGIRPSGGQFLHCSAGNSL